MPKTKRAAKVESASDSDSGPDDKNEVSIIIKLKGGLFPIFSWQCSLQSIKYIQRGREFYTNQAV
jgi:hypothetical protein